MNDEMTTLLLLMGLAAVATRYFAGRGEWTLAGVSGCVFAGLLWTNFPQYVTPVYQAVCETLAGPMALLVPFVSAFVGLAVAAYGCKRIFNID